MLAVMLKELLVTLIRPQHLKIQFKHADYGSACFFNLINIMIRNILYFILLNFLFSCHIKTNEYLDPKDSEKKFLDFDSLEFVYIESNEQSIISKIGKIIFEEDHFFIQDLGTREIYIFDSKGRYEYKISSNGSGPGEYLNIDDFYYDGKIHILDGRQNKILTYEKTGALEKEVTIEFLATKIHKLDNGNFVFYKGKQANNFENEDYFFEVILTDSLFNFKRGYESFEILQGVENSYLSQDDVFLSTETNLLFYKFYDPKIFIFSNEFDSLINFGEINFRPAKQDSESKTFNINFLQDRISESDEFPFGIFSLNYIDSSFVFSYLYNNSYYTAQVLIENSKFKYRTYQYYFNKNNEEILMPPVKIVKDGVFYYLVNKEFFDENWREKFINQEVSKFFENDNNPLLIKSKNIL